MKFTLLGEEGPDFRTKLSKIFYFAVEVAILYHIFNFSVSDLL